MYGKTREDIQEFVRRSEEEHLRLMNEMLSPEEDDTENVGEDDE